MPKKKPTPENPSSKEEPPKKNLQTESLMLTYIGGPQLCRTCRGSRYILTDDSTETCPACHGDGIQPTPRNG